MKKDFWDTLERPIIGLAPMDGYSDSAFRRICKEVNPNIVTVTEFTSADGLHYAPEKLKQKLQFDPSEQPVIAQIFGKNVETFVSATKFCEDMGFSGIDLNMGCPSKKVVRSEHGVALRKNPALACKLIEAVASATSLPVSVKTRLGWSNADDLVDFGKSAESAGANMVCIHARTYQQPYKVAPEYNPVRDLKEAVSIPIIGNGGVQSIEHGYELCNGLDGFYIGQATFGNPWIFSGNKPGPFKDRVPLILNHARYLIEDKGELVGTREIRKHLLAYVKGVFGSKVLRPQLSRVSSLNEIHQLLLEVSQKEMDYEFKTDPALQPA
jgi:tRNA-dihydrouridine synthase B